MSRDDDSADGAEAGASAEAEPGTKDEVNRADAAPSTTDEVTGAGAESAAPSAALARDESADDESAGDESAAPSAALARDESADDESAGDESAAPSAALAPAIATDDRDGPLRRFYARYRRFEIAFVVATALAILVPGVWAYTLIDPWETHYGEVGRRMLEDDDFVHLRWQNESFRSKPVLTFWLIGGSMRALGVADDGGYSGELATSDLAVFAVRLPFVLFAVMGITLIWWMLATLVNRRTAWLGFGVLITTPFFFLVARQAITDMPMVASLMGAMACFAVAVHAGDEPLRPIWRKLDGHHVLLAFLALIVGGQALYYLAYFQSHPRLAPGMNIVAPGWLLAIPMLLGLKAFALSSLWIGRGRRGWLSMVAGRTTTRRQLCMHWFYVLVAISVLAKGPPGIGLAGLICLLYIVLTGGWRLLARLEIPRGILLTVLIVVPWHVAMFFTDGRPWAKEYFLHHMLKRFGKGVHGDDGTFEYFASQIGIGMWPWVAILPFALALLFSTANRRTTEGRARLLVGIWSIAAVSLFCASETKFHHYILPAIPALALAVAFWLEDFIAGRVRKTALVALVGLGLVALIARDLLGEQEQLIELFIYRYDRPWPTGEPWKLDLRDPLLYFAIAFMAGVGLLALPRWRRWVVGGLLGTALVFALWCMNGYMGAAAPHWGQRALHQTYYAERDIHGVDIKYFSLRDLADDWDDGRYQVRSVLPEGFSVGQPARATLMVPGAGIPGDEIVVQGKVAAIGDDVFTLELDSGERERLGDLIDRGKRVTRSGRRPWVQVDADRLIAWQLNWRGENFWSSGEIYGQTEDTQTVFMKTNNKAFLEYLKGEGRAGRTYYIITESGRAKGFGGILPTPEARKSVEVLDTSCNKFTLLRFTL